MIPISWAAAACAVAFSAGAWLSYDYTQAKADQERLEAVTRAIEQQRALDAETLEIELAAAEQEKEVQVVYRDRVVEVVKYVESNAGAVDCFDDDGLRLYNEIRAGVDYAGGDSVREGAAPGNGN